jgi:hypothetical protein
MKIEKTAEKLFQMSDEVWQRHVNPWSVWTRYLGLPLLCIAIWARVWMGWMCLVPVTAVCFWIWINPRVFGNPHSTNNWASKAVLGERVFLDTSKAKIPEHHLKIISVLKIIMSIGCIFAV